MYIPDIEMIAWTRTLPAAVRSAISRDAVVELFGWQHAL